MWVISRRRLREFWERRFRDAEGPLNDWFRIMQAKQYDNPHQVRKDFSTASFLGDRRTVFNIGGNKYRVVVDMRYDLGRVYVRQVLTHEEYDEATERGTL